MKKRIAAICLAIALAAGAISAYAAYDVPEAYMGFSVAEDWYIFSKNMEDQAFLDAVGLTADDVNEALVKADCEYFITNPKEHAEIYVKVKKNKVAEEFYNISETEDEILRAELDRILKDGFSADQFTYIPEEVVITPYPQMKFVAIPGTAQYDGKKAGMVFGFTFVNGNGIAFMMQVDSETPGESAMQTVQDIASSVSFTVITDKGEAASAEETAKETFSQNSLQYIAGGLGALALAALCLYLMNHIRNSQTKSNAEKNYENDHSAD